MKQPNKFKNPQGNIIIENYVDCDVVLEEDECGVRVGINVFDCKGINLVIKGNVKMVMMASCKKSSATMTSRIVAPFEVINCDTIKVYAGTQMPHVIVEKSIEVKIFLNNATRGCCVQTTVSRNVLVKFPKEGALDTSEENDDWVTATASEVFETRVKGDKISTAPAEVGDCV